MEVDDADIDQSNSDKSNNPTLLGWVGFLGGLGSLIAGPFMFFDVAGLPIGLSIISAVIISIYMLVLGVLLWSEPGVPR